MHINMKNLTSPASIFIFIPPLNIQRPYEQLIKHSQRMPCFDMNTYILKQYTSHCAVIVTFSYTSTRNHFNDIGVYIESYLKRVPFQLTVSIIDHPNSLLKVIYMETYFSQMQSHLPYHNQRAVVETVFDVQSSI